MYKLLQKLRLIYGDLFFLLGGRERLRVIRRWRAQRSRVEPEPPPYERLVGLLLKNFLGRGGLTPTKKNLWPKSLINYVKIKKLEKIFREEVQLS